MVDSVKYLGITIDKNFRWSSRNSSCVNNFRRLSFYIRRLRYFQDKQTTILFVYLCFSRSLLLFPVTFGGLLTNEFRTLSSSSTISGIYYTPLEDLCIKPYDLHLFVYEKFAQNSLGSVPSLSECRSHAMTRSTVSSIPCRTYMNSTVPYLIRIHTNQECVANDFLHNLS